MHALRVRFVELRTSAPQLDHIYRCFVASADKIKTVEDGHLPEHAMVPSRTTTIPDTAVKGATWMAPPSHGTRSRWAEGGKDKAHAPHHHEREGEQEDYLWGV